MILHDFVLIIICNIIILMIIIVIFNIKNKFNFKSILQEQKLETYWTILPMFIIISIRIMSLNVLYRRSEIKYDCVLIKILRNQWFWNYRYPLLNIEYNSYLTLNEPFRFFMIETDNRIILPFNYSTILTFSSLDVIHSWTLPSMNLKMDCIPNQINSVIVKSLKPSVIYGQCSEICGINHRFIPIKVESIILKDILKLV